MNERRVAEDRDELRPFERCPKFDKHELSEDQITAIAKKAVLLAREEFYQEVGKSVTNKFFILIGMAAVAIIAALVRYGYIK